MLPRTYSWLKKAYLSCILTLHRAFAMCSSGQILRELTYPLQKVDAEERGVGAYYVVGA